MLHAFSIRPGLAVLTLAVLAVVATQQGPAEEVWTERPVSRTPPAEGPADAAATCLWPRDAAEDAG